MRNSEPKATISDPFTFGKSRAAQDLVVELLKIEPPRLRKYNIKRAQTLLSRCNLGVTELIAVEHPHIRFELLILWRKYWLEVVNAANFQSKVVTRVRSIIIEKTRAEMRIAANEIRTEKELRKLDLEKDLYYDYIAEVERDNHLP
jgi:hypothetical protein